MGIAQYDRNNYFSKTGVGVKECHSLEEVLDKSRLNYNVSKQQMYLADGSAVRGYQCTTKDDDGEQLSVVGEKYSIVQNREGFDFLDSLASEGMRFETAGHYDGYNKTFIVGRTDNVDILGDNVSPYILFTNSFDGTGAIKVIFTPIRVFCSNCINMAIKNATNVISIKHTGDVQTKLFIARDIMRKNSEYMQALKSNSEELAKIKLTKKQFELIAPEIVKQSSVVKVKANAELTTTQDDMTKGLIKAYNQSDLNNYKDTAYKAVQAVADYESHFAPIRVTNNDFIYMNRVLKGMVMLNTAVKIINDMPKSRRFFK